MPTVHGARHAAWALTLLPMLWAAPPAVAGEPLTRYFEQVCLDRERPELANSPSGPWIASVCAEEARFRAEEFGNADHERRLASLAADCQSWYDRNAWRFGRRMLENRARWDRIVGLKCRAEAVDELPLVEAKLTEAAAAPSALLASKAH